MSLDKNYVVLDDALKIARQYYDDETFEHAVRVMNFVSANAAIPDSLKNDCRCLAIMHDLLEDTDYDPSGLPKNFKKALKLLTKPDEANYDDYCEKIHYLNFKRYGLCAWFVKLADIKDHLSQVDTLTPRLKEKYLSGMRYLL